MGTLFNTFTVEEIETQGGVFNRSTLNFQNQTFRRSLRCRKTMQNAIQDYCRIAKQNGHQFVLVEEESFISIWRQAGDESQAKARSQPLSSRAASSDTTIQQAQAEPMVLTQAKRTLVALSPELIDCCRKALLVSVGPIASLVLNEIQAKSANMSAFEFIEALGNRLPNSDLKQAFLKELMTGALDHQLVEKVRTLL